MANISDLIEKFLLSALSESMSININRNELADYFDCAPSQINYVLATRFTLDKGFVIESRRGGGGYITLLKIIDKTAVLDDIAKLNISEGISYSKALRLLDRLIDEDRLTEREGELIGAMLSDKALVAPGVNKDAIRASLLKSLAKTMTKKGGELK